MMSLGSKKDGQRSVPATLRRWVLHLELTLLAMILRLYPGRFRDRFGDEWLQLHRLRRGRQPNFSGKRVLVSFFDALIGVPLAWLDEWRARDGSSNLGEPSMKNFVYEAASTFRVLFTRHRSFTALSLLTLTLGLGAATAIFSVVHGVLIAPMPYGEPERIVRIFQQSPDRGFGVFSGPNFNDLRDRAQSFEVLAAFDGYRPEGADLTGTDRVERLRILRVSSGYFETLGIEPFVGRTFTRDEELPINAAEIA